MIQYRHCFLRATCIQFHRDNRTDAKLGTYKSLHFTCSALWPKHWIGLSQCNSVLHRHAISQLLSTSRMHFIGHVDMNHGNESMLKCHIQKQNTQKTLNCFESMRFSVAVLHRHAISQLLSTSRLHFIDHVDMNHGHVVINQCESAKFRNKTLQMFRLQHVVQVQAIYNINLKNKWASSWDYGTFCPL